MVILQNLCHNRVKFHSYHSIADFLIAASLSNGCLSKWVPYWAGCLMSIWWPMTWMFLFLRYHVKAAPPLSFI